MPIFILLSIRLRVYFLLYFHQCKNAFFSNLSLSLTYFLRFTCGLVLKYKISHMHIFRNAFLAFLKPNAVIVVFFVRRPLYRNPVIHFSLFFC